jgi:cell division protein FtsN
MWGWGPGGWDFFDILGRIASFTAGVILFLIWLAVIILFVRFLLIATRAAKVYLRNNGHADGVLPSRPASPAAPAAATTTTTAPPTRPAPKTPRTPKTPPPAI